MNDFAFNAINSNSEERTSSMSDYSTSTTPNGTQYQENTPTITPEIEIVDAEVLDDIDDADLVETNPVAALAGNFQDDERTAHPLAPGETNYTEQEARQATEDIKVKILHTAEAQYDLVHAVEKAFDGHIWVALGYPEGMKGWIAYCADNFAAEKIRVTGQQRTDLITGFTPGKITNRGIAALLGVHHSIVDRAKAQAGISTSGEKIRDAAGKLRHVDAGSMSSEERRKKIVELSEEGAKQTDIADLLDVSQSTVSDTLRKDRMRRMSEGLEPAKIDNTDFDSADDDQPLDLDMGNRETDIRSYIDSFVSQSSGRPRRHQRDGASAGIRQVAAGRLHGERDRLPWPARTSSASSATCVRCCACWTSTSTTSSTGRTRNLMTPTTTGRVSSTDAPNSPSSARKSPPDMRPGSDGRIPRGMGPLPRH